MKFLMKNHMPLLFAGALAIQFPGSTLEEAIGGVRSWLRNAPQREGGKPAEAFAKM